MLNKCFTAIVLFVFVALLAVACTTTTVKEETTTEATGLKDKARSGLSQTVPEATDTALPPPGEEPTAEPTQAPPEPTEAPTAEPEPIEEPEFPECPACPECPAGEVLTDTIPITVTGGVTLPYVVIGVGVGKSGPDRNELDLRRAWSKVEAYGEVQTGTKAREALLKLGFEDDDIVLVLFSGLRIPGNGPGEARVHVRDLPQVPKDLEYQGNEGFIVQNLYVNSSLILWTPPDPTDP